MNKLVSAILLGTCGFIFGYGTMSLVLELYQHLGLTHSPRSFFGGVIGVMFVIGALRSEQEQEDANG